MQWLQTDYVDIYYAHHFDLNTDIWETAQTLDQVVRSGKVLYVGISNFDAKQAKTIGKMFNDLGTPYTVNQISYDIFNRQVKESSLFTELKQQNRGIVTYGSLVERLLSDRYLN